MNYWKTAIAALCISAFAVCASAGDFKDMLKSAKKKAQEAVGAAQNVPPPAASPAATPAAPASQPKAGSPTATPAGGAKAQPAANGKPVYYRDVPWPNIATDPAIVKQQQVAFGKECREKLGNRPDQDCGCFEAKYPEARLKTLSEDTRDLEKRAHDVCRGKVEGCQEPDAVLFRWITQPNTQKKYPTTEGQTAHPRYYTFRTSRESMNEAAMIVIGDSCRNDGYVAKQHEDECVQNVKSGLTPLKPGTSTKAYCKCIGEKWAARDPSPESSCANP